MNEKVAALTKIQKQLQYMIIAMLIFTIAAFICAIKFRQYSFVFVLILLALYLFGYRGLVRRYKSYFKDLQQIDAPDGLSKDFYLFTPNAGTAGCIHFRTAPPV